MGTNQVDKIDLSGWLWDSANYTAIITQSWVVIAMPDYGTLLLCNRGEQGKNGHGKPADSVSSLCYSSPLINSSHFMASLEARAFWGIGDILPRRIMVSSFCYFSCSS